MYLFIIPIVVGLIAQALKPLLNKKWYAHLTEGGKKIPRYGGMPSAHTAFATSLVTTVAMIEGIHSALFVVAVALLIFVLDDALRMRIFLSRHGEAIQRLVDRLPEEERKGFPYLEARLGHKITEVIAGGVLGVVLTWLIMSIIAYT